MGTEADVIMFCPDLPNIWLDWSLFMKKVSWIRTLGEVLQEKTVPMEFTSAKGTKYSTDVVKVLSGVALGSPTAKTDESGAVIGYSYRIFLAKKDMEFSISAPEKLEIGGFSKVRLFNVRGGALMNRDAGWFKATHIEVEK